MVALATLRRSREELVGSSQLHPRRGHYYGRPLVVRGHWSMASLGLSRLARCVGALLLVACSCEALVRTSRAEDLGACRTGLPADMTVRACSDLIALDKLSPAALSDAYYVRALVWRDRNESERQLADLNEAVRIDSLNARALVARGI